MLALAGITGIFAVGCSSNNSQPATSAAISDQAVTCDKCKTTWVSVPHYATGNPSRAVVAYSEHKEMTCPECRTAAENFFATGKLEHACKTCGPDALKVCEKH
jgi:hypothetical protein